MAVRNRRFDWEISDITFSQCQYCIHHHPYMVCDAFPEGIPEEIQSNKVIHDHTVEGDHGILFEVIPALSDDYDEFLADIESEGAE